MVAEGHPSQRFDLFDLISIQPLRRLKKNHSQGLMVYSNVYFPISSSSSLEI